VLKLNIESHGHAEEEGRVETEAPSKRRKHNIRASQTPEIKGLRENETMNLPPKHGFRSIETRERFAYREVKVQCSDSKLPRVKI
jgi:hypothetical protein